MAGIEKSKVKKMNNPYFDKWQSVFSDLAYKCSLMCTLEKECLETPIRIPSQVWDDTDSLESGFMSKSIGEVIETIDRIYDGLYNARYGETDGYDASAKKSKMKKSKMKKSAGIDQMISTAKTLNPIEKEQIENSIVNVLDGYGYFGDFIRMLEVASEGSNTLVRQTNQMLGVPESTDDYWASTKKALPIYDDHEIICPYCGEVARPSRDPAGAYVAYCNNCDRPLEEDELAFGDDIGLSAKKSKMKKSKSFTNMVNDIRKQRKG